MSVQLDQLIRSRWWVAVATLCRLTGDLEAAEDAVQEACVVALEQWPSTGVPDNALGWLIGVARHKALDRLRREAVRGTKEAASMRESMSPVPNRTLRRERPTRSVSCSCAATRHCRLEARVALTLRSVCGLSTAEIAAAFLVPEATMAKRLVRAKAKIREARIPFRVPGKDELPDRLGAVLRVVYLVFTEGHMASRGDALVRGDLCDTAIWFARGVVGLLPEEPEAMGLLALLLLTDARRAARSDDLGELVLLEDQDRRLWDAGMIAEGEALLEAALRKGLPGPYQLQAAVAACHSTASSAGRTDWRQIALLYAELIRYEPTPVVEANRAVALAMAEGPAAGLVILDALAHHPQLQCWAQLHIARAELLKRLGRNAKPSRSIPRRSSSSQPRPPGPS